MSRYQRAILMDPADTRLIGMDFGELLAADQRGTADITGYAVIAPLPLVVVSSERSGSRVTAYVGGAVAGERYDVSLRLTLTHPAGDGPDVAYERTIRIQGAEQ